jgi:hypothetical protein
MNGIQSADKSGMKLRNAALFALIAVALWTLLLAIELIRNTSGLAGGFVSASAFLASLIRFLAALSLTVFFFVFHRAQS